MSSLAARLGMSPEQARVGSAVAIVPAFLVAAAIIGMSLVAAVLLAALLFDGAGADRGEPRRRDRDHRGDRPASWWLAVAGGASGGGGSLLEGR